MQPTCFLRRALATGAVAAIAALGTAAQAVTLVGLTSASEIARFDSANPGSDSRVAITGLAAGDRLIGIDLRPSNNTIYGLGVQNRLYTVNELTGVATVVAALSSPVISASLGYGIDFNPVADYSGATSLRLVSSAGDNFAINAASGAVTVATSIAAGYSGVAYSNSAPFSANPGSTALYYLNSSADSLAVATTGFNAPTINAVGPLGVDALRANGFEIAPDGTAYAALNVDAGPSLTSGLYTVNLATGAATAIGTFNGTLSGLTISAVPEPGAFALLGIGLGVVGVVARQRRGAR